MQYVKQLKKIECAFRQGYSVNVENGDVFGLFNQILKPQKLPSGHVVVTLQTPGFNKRNESVLTVHSLVAYKKYGKDAFLKGLEIRHLNNIPYDNRGENLEPGTRSQNLLDIPINERKIIGIKKTRHLVGKPNCNRKLSDKDILEIRELLKTGRRGIKIKLAEQYKISHSVISRISNGGAYEHVR